jgi:hypothetical protein
LVVWLGLIAVWTVLTESLGVPLGFHSPEFVAAMAADILGLAVIYRTGCSRMEPWIRGINGEDLVGRVLSELEAAGWRSLHGLRPDVADIDHVAVGPGGVVTIETKQRQGMVTARHISRRLARQAAAHRRRLSEIVPNVAEVDVLLVINAPEVELVGTRVRDVLVLSVERLADGLRDRPFVMSPDEIGLIYDEIVLAFALRG